MDELEALKVIKSALDSLDESDRNSALTWLFSKYGNGQAAQPAPENGSSSGLTSAKQAKPEKAAKPAKKSKVVLKILKDLQIDVGGKNAKEFIAARAPSNLLQKSVVAVYYLKNEINLETVSADHVFTFFKYVGWPIPKDPLNTLQQAGTKGWLDTKLSTDIKITHMGENVVEHQLSAKK